jgi:hypothetical protein
MIAKVWQWAVNIIHREPQHLPLFKSISFQNKKYKNENTAQFCGSGAGGFNIILAPQAPESRIIDYRTASDCKIKYSSNLFILLA